MTTKNGNGPRGKKPTSPAINFIAGGGAGMMEALVCHPLDTIKVRMQLSKRKKMLGERPRGFFATAKYIIDKETFWALYKGLGPVLTGIMPKMALRFTSYEWYKQQLADNNGHVSGQATLLAGLAAGITEAVGVVTPMEVIKIRLQAQYHSMADPLTPVKHRNAGQAIYNIVREEGISALYRGVSLTALRQGTNQAVNFTVFSQLKTLLQQSQPKYTSSDLPSYQTGIIGCISGAMGPLSNAPIDTIKTRLQRGDAGDLGLSALGRIREISRQMFKTEGMKAFYSGITPRIIRVAPGQGVTFMVYERLKVVLEEMNWSSFGGKYEE